MSPRDALETLYALKAQLGKVKSEPRLSGGAKPGNNINTA
jgi:hypothetical protein